MRKITQRSNGMISFGRKSNIIASSPYSPSSIKYQNNRIRRIVENTAALFSIYSS